ncbi:MAG: universal stress protein [Vulcanimicrobiota bacterium]
MVPFKKILCPIDFSEPSLEALKAADELAVHFDAQLILLNVTDVVPIAPATYSPAAPVPTPFDVPSYQLELKKMAKKKLDEVRKKYVTNKNKTIAVVVQGDTAKEIVEKADEADVDLIIIATHGHSGWGRFIFGSVAEKVIRLATRPVLTIQEPLKAKNELEV